MREWWKEMNCEKESECGGRLVAAVRKEKGGVNERIESGKKLGEID